MMGLGRNSITGRRRCRRAEKCEQPVVVPRPPHTGTPGGACPAVRDTLVPRPGNAAPIGPSREPPHRHAGTDRRRGVCGARYPTRSLRAPSTEHRGQGTPAPPPPPMRAHQQHTVGGCFFSAACAKSRTALPLLLHYCYCRYCYYSCCCCCYCRVLSRQIPRSFKDISVYKPIVVRLPLTRHLLGRIFFSSIFLVFVLENEMRNAFLQFFQP